VEPSNDSRAATTGSPPHDQWRGLLHVSTTAISGTSARTLKRSGERRVLQKPTALHGLGTKGTPRRILHSISVLRDTNRDSQPVTGYVHYQVHLPRNVDVKYCSHIDFSKNCPITWDTLPPQYRAALVNISDKQSRSVSISGRAV
jgi:hypothetical protein